MFAIAKVIAFLVSTRGLIIAAIVAIATSFSGAYLKGRSDGYLSCKTKWDAAELNATEEARKARRDAEHTEPNGSMPDDRHRRPD